MAEQPKNGNSPLKTFLTLNEKLLGIMFQTPWYLDKCPVNWYRISLEPNKNYIFGLYGCMFYIFTSYLCR